MWHRAFALVISALVSGALFSGCAAGGSSMSQGPGSIPGAGPSITSRASRPGVQANAARRTLSLPGCSTNGSGSFVGIANGGFAGGTDSVMVGGLDNEACEERSAIVGGVENLIAADGGSESFIGGGSSNNIGGSSTTDSGILAGYSNEILAKDSVITGGFDNLIFVNGDPGSSFIGAGGANGITGAEAAVIAGNFNGVAALDSAIGAGLQNRIASTASYGFIGAGLYNVVSGEGGFAGAGGYNTVGGEGAVIDGGFNSTAAGNFATIPGGYVNSAAGTYSFAAGARASAAQTGTFVWSDGSDGDAILTSSRAYQFLARASGGVTFWTNAASTVGATLAPGSGTWASASDRNLKTDVARIDDAAVLAKVAALPIERWSYKSERGVRHVGPMAQDFYAAFGVGEDDKHITSIDEDGIALAAIKALHAENADAHAAMKALHARVGVLDAENVSLRGQLAALKASQARRDLLVDRQLERLTAAVSASRER